MESSPRTRKLILLPGLGADAELFFPQKDFFGDDLNVCCGPRFDDIKDQTPSLDEAARRTATLLGDAINVDEPFVLGGMSFGGSLAVQMVALGLISPTALILISSNRTSTTISNGFRWQRRIGSRLPIPLIRAGLGFASRLFARREKLNEAQAARLSRMAQRANIDELLWGAAAIDRWQLGEADVSNLEIPIHQIHGVGDWVIPIHQPHVTESISNGRHLITWTHADRVNVFLESVLSSS